MTRDALRELCSRAPTIEVRVRCAGPPLLGVHLAGNSGPLGQMLREQGHGFWIAEFKSAEVVAWIDQVLEAVPK
jgi:hypothetical protein